MKPLCCWPIVSAVFIIPFVDFILCDLCPTSSSKHGPKVYLSCDSCCGPEDDQFCCEDVTTTSAPETTTKEPEWWVVGVCGSISLILVIIFTVVLLVCTKKKMQARILEGREMTVMPAQTFHETSFTRAITVEPARPPPYAREIPTDRPPSYQSQRSARRSARYSERNQQNSIRNIAPIDTCVSPSIRPTDSGRPPEYTTMYLPETEVPRTQSSSQINTQSVLRVSDNRNANRPLRRGSEEIPVSPMSPPPPYSRHAYL